MELGLPDNMLPLWVIQANCRHFDLSAVSTALQRHKDSELQLWNTNSRQTGNDLTSLYCNAAFMSVFTWHTPVSLQSVGFTKFRLCRRRWSITPLWAGRTGGRDPTRLQRIRTNTNASSTLLSSPDLLPNRLWTETLCCPLYAAVQRMKPWEAFLRWPWSANHKMKTHLKKKKEKNSHKTQEQITEHDCKTKQNNKWMKCNDKRKNATEKGCFFFLSFFGVWLCF